MCRLIALHADRPLSAAGPLSGDPHSLLTQSCGDRRGERHGDGWGIGYYADGRPQIVRSIHPARDDPEFAATAQRIRSHTVLGHVRQASVGNISLENTHPFAWGPWLFAHNGTITGFAALERQLCSETEPELLAGRRGATDSELAFFWLLTRLVSAGEREAGLCSPLEDVVQRLAGALRLLDSRCRAADAMETARFNFVLTDGRMLLATRWQHSLSWRTLDEPAAGVLIASEPTGAGSWQELPDHSILAVNGNLAAHVYPA